MSTDYLICFPYLPSLVRMKLDVYDDLIFKAQYLFWIPCISKLSAIAVNASCFVAPNSLTNMYAVGWFYRTKREKAIKKLRRPWNPGDRQAENRGDAFLGHSLRTTRGTRNTFYHVSFTMHQSH